MSENQEILTNSLSGVVQNLTLSGQFNIAQVSQTDTMHLNLRYYLLSNDRQTLSQMYVEHGVIQTLVDQPVDDAFRAGFEIKTEQFDSAEIEQLENFLEKERVIASAIQSIKWSRLYGGGAVLIITDQDPLTPFNIKAINEKTPLEFRAADMWELFSDQNNTQGSLTIQEPEFYTYYGHKVHKSRVHIIKGKEPPSFIRPRLRGWGMSELERTVRSINMYLKNQNVAFDLLDEAKVDVYKMKGFNTALLTSTGSAGVSNRIQMANAIKNYQNAITMDVDDDYDQKQVTFAGLSDILTQIRQGLASDLRMPMTKLFGISSAGFSSGEDDIENYNSMVESEVRYKVKFLLVDIIGIACQKLFGIVPDDMKVIFKPLRILGADQEEKVKDSQFNRIMQAYSSGLATAQESKEGINKASLLPHELDETTDAEEPIDLGDGFQTTTTGA